MDSVVDPQPPIDRPRANRPTISRKFGRNFERWERTDEGSIGHRYIGKVCVDCKFRLRESEWGVLGDPKRPAGVIYVDISFNQPKECRLNSATVYISLEECENKVPKTARRSGNTVAGSLHVTDHFGPKLLVGPAISSSEKIKYSAQPELNVMGIGGGGVGATKEKLFTYSSRWVLTGDSIILDNDHRMPSHTYKTLKWELAENDLEVHSIHNRVFHTAFAFGHDEKPFYFKVRIKGTLRSLSDRIKHLRFPSNLNRKQGTSLTLVQLGPNDEILQNNQLDELARGLEAAMVQKNLLRVAREVPDSSQLQLREQVDTSEASGEPDTNKETEQENDGPTEVAMMQELSRSETTDLNDPLNENLARAVNTYGHISDVSTSEHMETPADVEPSNEAVEVVGSKQVTENGAETVEQLLLRYPMLLMIVQAIVVFLEFCDRRPKSRSGIKPNRTRLGVEQ